MTAAATPPLVEPVRGRVGTAAARVWSGVLALWGAVTGVAPHVLHHVGPFAGAALLAGATGRMLFAAIGFAAAIPFLLRLRGRFATWKAPAVALAVFVAIFSLSTFVIGPVITGNANDTPNQEQPGEHMGHQH